MHFSQITKRYFLYAQQVMKTVITSFHVARVAQVSQSAVSRTFTPGASVSEGTRRKVMEAARMLGYRPNAHARSLITKRSRIIGVVLSYLDNLFYPIALQRLAEHLQRDGYHVLLFINENPNADNLVNQLLGYHVDGIVIASATLSSGLARQCAESGIPVVLFNRVMARGSEGAVSSVRGDNLQGGSAVANFLLDGGHRRVAYIAGSQESSTNLERERGFREALEARGSRVWSFGVGNYTPSEAAAAARLMFGRPNDRPDAVFVASDHMAFAVMDTLRFELGLRVPDDVSVVGFDDVPQASWASYELTTVAQPLDRMVIETVNLLRSYLRDDSMQPAQTVVLSGELKIRSSTRVLSPSPKRRSGKRRTGYHG